MRYRFMPPFQARAGFHRALPQAIVSRVETGLETFAPSHNCNIVMPSAQFETRGAPGAGMADGSFPIGRAKMGTGEADPRRDKLVRRNNRGYQGVQPFSATWAASDAHAEQMYLLMIALPTDTRSHGTDRF